MNNLREISAVLEKINAHHVAVVMAEMRYEDAQQDHLLGLNNASKETVRKALEAITAAKIKVRDIVNANRFPNATFFFNGVENHYEVKVHY